MCLSLSIINRHLIRGYTLLSGSFKMNSSDRRLFWVYGIVIGAILAVHLLLTSRLWPLCGVADETSIPFCPMLF